MNNDQVFYLSSLDSYRFEAVRECRFLRFIGFETGKIAVIAALSPGVPGQDFGEPGDIESFVLSTRFEGASISPINEFPCFVFIAIPSTEWDRDRDEITATDLHIVGWGELYRSASDAASHSFE